LKTLLNKLAGSALASISFIITIYIFGLSKNYLLAAPAVMYISFIASEAIEKYSLKQRINTGFLEFTTLLLSFESNGLHINDLFHKLATGEVTSPKVYIDIARQYVGIEKLIGDVRRSLSILIKNLPKTKLTKFLEGYIGILETTGDTLRYTESIVENELNELRNSTNNLLALVENFYEVYLVSILTIIVITSFPGILISPDVVYLVLFLTNIVAYTISSMVSSRIFYHEPSSMSIATIILFALLIVFIKILGTIYTLVIMIIVIVLSSFISNEILGWRKRVEYSLHELIEDLYVEAQHGFPIDRALNRLSEKDTAYSWIASELSKILSLGVKGGKLADLVDTTPFITKILRLVLSPIEYSGNHSRHLGYVLRYIRRINSIRNSVKGRANVLYAYTLILPPTIYVVAYSLQSMASSGFLIIDPTSIPSYVMVSSIPAWIIVSKITNGCGLCSLKTLFIVLENLLLYILISL